MSISKFLILLILFTLLNAKVSFGELIRVFAASDLQYALREIAEVYMKKYPEDRIELIFGSSGKGYAKIKQGAPYHIFLSADMDYVQRLYREGLIVTEPKPYAVGRIVVWTRKESPLNPSKFPEVLLQPNVKKIALANWEHAPYGKAGKEALEAYGIFEKVRSKIVLGENISQTASFVFSGSADIGIIALSLALAPELQKRGKFWLIPEDKHSPLIQGYGITAEGSKLINVRRFYDFISSKKARDIFIKYGFLLPGEKSADKKR